MDNYICKIERAFQPGGLRPSEDHLVCAGDLFGVFDGASSLVADLYDGWTGALWASHLVSSEFAKNDAPLIDLGLRANERLRFAMATEGVDSDDKLACWSTSAAVLKVGEKTLEWLQIGDSQIMAITDSGEYRLLTDYYNHDSLTLKQLKSLFEQGDSDPHKTLKPYVEQVRRQMNRNYGAMNGAAEALDFFKAGSCPLNGISHLLLFTDGLLPPSEDPEQEHDFQWIADLYLQGGLSLVQEQIRRKEMSDPECRFYPRFKTHDDIAAIALSLN